MGTNYYWTLGEEDDRENPKNHIGKRSSAGKFCWECGVSLVDGHVFAECPCCEQEVVTYAYSFLWTMFRHRIFLENLAARKDPAKLVVDQYGNAYTAEEFLRELSYVAFHHQSYARFS